eukprot:1149923-Pelagomonas_calceolata.AAC.5
MPDAGDALCACAEQRRAAHAPHPELGLQGMTFSSPAACSCCWAPPLTDQLPLPPLDGHVGWRISLEQGRQLGRVTVIALTQGT